MQSLIANKQDNFIKTSFLPCLQHLRVRVCAHLTYPILRLYDVLYQLNIGN